MWFILITSILTSLIGWVFFHYFLKGRFNHKSSRWILYGIVIASFSLPSAYQHLLKNTNVGHSTYLASAITNQQSCSVEEAQAECRRINRDGEFCDCSAIIEQNLVAYHSNQFYDVLKAFGPKLLFGFKVGGSIIFILLIFRLFYLIYVIRSYRSQQKTIAGYSVSLISGVPFQPGSFKLWKNYVLWNPQLDQLSEEEKEAILLHEISHLKQYNTVELIFLQLLQIFWFINPAFYFIRKELVAISEFIADQFVLGQQKLTARDYVELMLELKDKPKHQWVSAFSQNTFKRRVYQLIDNGTKKQRTTVAGVFAILGLFLTLNITAASSAVLTTQVQDEVDHYHVMKTENNTTGRNIFCLECHLYDFGMSADMDELCE